MTDLTTVVDRTEHCGILVVGDIHANYGSAKKAVDYARLHRLFIIFLGDLVDGDHEPFETISLVHDVVTSGAGALILGNHDYKFVRYAAGNKVILKDMHLATLSDCGDKVEEFLEKIIELGEHKCVGFVHTYGRLVLAHGAVHRTVWSDPHTVTKKIRERALYGEVNGDRDEHDFPIRRYSWVDDIPSGSTTIIGHDRRPFGGELLEDTGPMVVRNSVGGKAFFVDTGCGKTDTGYLTGTIFSIDVHNETVLSFDRFVKF